MSTYVSPKVEYEPRFQFVMQGGGAKLAVLIAAAQALFELSRDKEIIITRVAGASAGAIASCMLQSSREPEMFRQYLAREGDRILKSIRPERNYDKFAHRTKMFYDVYKGRPLYNHLAYRNFLGNMFKTVAEMEHLKELSPVLIYATDIMNGAPKRYDGTQPQDTIKDALFDSSALPFIFTSYANGSICDGGMINNFPGHELATGMLGDGEVIGLTFQRSGQYHHPDAFRYALALMFTSMDVSVAKAISALKKENIYEIKTDIDTLDFESALQFIKSSGNYRNYVEVIKSFVRNIVQKRRIEFETVRDLTGTGSTGEVECLQKDLADNKQVARLISSIKNYHQMVLNDSEYVIASKVLLSTCNTLAGDMRPRCDIIVTREILMPKSDVSAYLATILTDSEGVDLDTLHPVVRKYRGAALLRNDVEYNIVPIRIPDQFTSKNTKEAQYLMLFINPSLKAEPGVSYEIAYSLKASSVLSDLVSEKKEDFYVYRSRSELKLLKLLFFVPKNFNIYLENMNLDARRQLEERFSLASLHWIDGRRIDEADSAGYNEPPGMKLVGWQANDLRPGQAVGVRAKV